MVAEQIPFSTLRLEFCTSFLRDESYAVLLWLEYVCNHPRQRAVSIKIIGYHFDVTQEF